MSELLFLLAGYLVGSFPTGYLAVRFLRGRDIRSEGSGKTGGFNTFSVTQSRVLAVSVGLFDAFKGFAVALAAWKLAPGEPLVQAGAIIGAVLGHNYPVWLRFKGGRGLATVAGALFALGQFLLVFWCLFWVGFYVWKKDIMRANILACLASLLAVWLVPHEVLGWFMIRDVDPVFYAQFITAVLAVLLVGHADGIREWLIPRKGEGVERA